MSCDGCLGVSRAAEVPAALGLTPSVVRRLVKDGVLVRLRQGVLVGACHVERAAQDTAAAHRLSVQALLLQYDDAYASHESAAVVHGVPVLHMPPAPRVTREEGAWRGGDAVPARLSPFPTCAGGVGWPPRPHPALARPSSRRRARYKGPFASADVRRYRPFAGSRGLGRDRGLRPAEPLLAGGVVECARGMRVVERLRQGASGVGVPRPAGGGATRGCGAGLSS